MKKRTFTWAKRCENHQPGLLISTVYSAFQRYFRRFSRQFSTNLGSFIGLGCCALCRETTGSSLDLCQNCVANLPFCTVSCESCALPLQLQHSGERHYCGRCSAMPPPARRVLSACVYRYPADVMVHRLKYSAELHWGRIMGSLITTRVRSTYQYGGPDPNDAVDLLIPIPLSRRRHRQRGYNQSVEIATAISRELAIPVCRQALVRRKHSRPQAGLSATERRRNIKKVFTAHGVEGRRVVLVDDVLTTGTTVFDATRALLGAGAASVDVWVFARTP